jgi:RNA polymerase sigma factor (sigma-70 family)
LSQCEEGELETDEERNRVSEILRALNSKVPEQAWATFLECYARPIFQVVRLFETDEDDVGSCFLFVCEELSRHGFRRLRRFKLSGAASFVTWLHIVVRRLCLDWHRKEFGRSRVFESIARLSGPDQAVFGIVFERRIPVQAALLPLSGRFPNLTQEELETSCDRIRQALGPRQLWLLATRQPQIEAVDTIIADENTSPYAQIRDPAPDPETLAAQRQQRARLARALAGLSAPDRLLIRLRFEQELTLQQVARLMGFPDPQTADRRLKQILARLRKNIGRTQAASV